MYRRRINKLVKNEEKAVIVRIFWLTIFSLILIFIIFTSGVSFLGKFADLLGSVFESNNENEIDKNTSGPPQPILDPLPDATNEKLLKISGFSSSSDVIEIYIDSKLLDSVEVNNGRFEYGDVLLQNGENLIQLKAKDSSGTTSDFSPAVTIIFNDEEPELEVSSPVENQNFANNNRIKVTGKTETDAQVLANGFLANVESDGNFELIIPLVEGENEIEIQSQDAAGNITIKKIKVFFKK